MLKLDTRDKKLLYELDLNSRQSFSELSRKLRLSKPAVINRVNKLLKEGVIKQFHTVVDEGKLGFISFRLYVKLQDVTPAKTQEIIDFLKNKEQVTWVVSIEGSYDIGAFILTKTISEINELWQELLEKYINYISKRLLTITTKVRYFSRAYLIGLKENLYENSFVSEPQDEKLDKIDLRILQLVAANARAPIIEIARKIGVTSKTVIDRLKKLERKKVIIGYRTVFDLEKLGYQYFKVHFLLHNLTKEKKQEFKQYIKIHPNIIYDTEVLGGDDIEVEIQAKDFSELRAILDDIKGRFAEAIKEYKIMLFYKEHKYLFFPIRL